MAMLVMLLGRLTVTTWYFAYSSPRLAVNRVTDSLRKDILNSTVGFLYEVFRWNAYAARSLAGMLEKELLGDGTSLESFIKIRAASFSLFRAIPLATSIGATSINGLTGLYVRGGLTAEAQRGETAPVYIYTKSAGPHPPLYIENVDIITGDAVGFPVEYQFREHLKDNGKPYIQCGIPIVTKKMKDVTLVHCSHSADDITRCLSTSLDLKDGNVFVVNDVGDVVFTSEGQHCISKNRSEPGGCEHQSEVAKALRFLESRMQVTELVWDEIHFTDVRLGGRSHSLDRRNQHNHGKLQRQLEAKWRAEASRDAKTAFLSHMRAILLRDLLPVELRNRVLLGVGLNILQKRHELRTPMACIIGLLDILMRELKMSEHQSSVRQVHRCATSLVSLLNSALDIAKVEVGKLELEITEFDLETELTSLVEVFSVSCDAKGLHLGLQLSDDIPKLVKGDPARVMQVFTNLIGNSIKFTSKGRIIVRGWVDTESASSASMRESGRNHQVVLKFEVDELSAQEPHGGTGLGLGIVRSLVHLMGGDIKIGDKTGEGSVFQFSLCFECPDERKNSRYGVIKRHEVILGMPEKDCRSVVAQWMERRRLTVHQVASWEDASLQLDIRGHLQNGRKLDNKTEKKISLLYKEDTVEETQRIQRSLAPHSGHPRRTKPNSRLKKPMLILEVDLLPRNFDYVQAFEKLGLIPENRNRQPVSESGNPRTQFGKSAKVHAVVWVLASNTPDSLKKSLVSLSRTTCRSLLVRRPLHPLRLRELFYELECEEKNFLSETIMSDDLSSSVTAASPSVNVGKQLGVELSTDDAALPLDTSDSVKESVADDREIRVIGQEASLKPTTNETASFVSSETRKPKLQMQRNPLIRSHSDDTQKYIGESELPLESKPLQGLNILVAEVPVVLRMLASALLKKLGATPFLVCNGQETVQAVVTRFESGRSPFDCILMDCQMPVMNGHDACNAVRGFERDKDQRTCIIALTANAMASDEKRCFLVGMDAFLTKTMEQERLVQVMLKTLNSQSSRRGKKFSPSRSTGTNSTAVTPLQKECWDPECLILESPIL